MTAGVVVVGSYPPIPLPAADASVAVVREAWAAGEETTVVSPRLSAADLVVPVVGVLAGHRLENVRRHTGATRLILVAERGFPVPAGAPRILAWSTAAGLSRAMRRFDHVRVVKVGDLGLPNPTEARLLGAADEVVAYPGGGPTGGVTPLGPPEVLPHERPRLLAVGAARRVLGDERLRALRGRLRRS